MDEFVKNRDWSILSSVFGSSHSSVIGFISTEWVRPCPDAIVMDGAPSPSIGTGRAGQIKADLLLIGPDNRTNIVEVETTHWIEKVDSLAGYLDDPKYAKSEGLLVLTTVMGTVNANKRIEISEKDAAKLTKTKDKIIGSRKPIHVVQLIRTEWKDYPTPQMAHMLELRGSHYYRYRVYEVRHWNPAFPESESVIYRHPVLLSNTDGD